jgi:tRNA wybutosine-synthesizing protein 4
MLEQHLPAGVDHPFAKTMVDHFNKQTPLRALNSYPTIDSQRMRFAACHWPDVRIRNLWSLWQDDAFVDHSTKCALDGFEPFDEWEEFAMFAGHYFLLTATTHEAFKFLPLNLSGTSPEAHKLESACEELSTHIQMLTTPNPKAQGQRRFGAVFDVNKDSFAHHGGIVSMTRHTDSDVYTRSEEPVNLVNPPESILCHTITTLHDGSVLFAGGRRSPASASAMCYLRENGKWNKTHDLYPARYRQCSVAVTLGSRAGVLTFGGRTRQAHVLEEWQLYDRERGWKVVKSDSQIPGVFGAAMVATSGTSGILLGGMTSSGTVLSHYLEWELVQEEDGALKVRYKYVWKPRPEGAGGGFVGLSRFGAQLVQTRWGLVLIGGIGPHGVLGADEEVILIESDGTIQHTTAISGLLKRGAPRPMLTGHSTKVVDNDEIIIIGGGGVCFSFGAFWNDSHYIFRSASSADKATAWRLASADKASSVLQGRMEQLSSNSVPFECAENNPGTIPKALQHAQEITHVKISSPEAFQRLVSAAQPIILQSMDLGPCSSLWTAQYLKEKIGPDRAVIVHSSNEPHLSFLKKNFTYETQPFNTFIDAAMSGSHVYLRALSSENPSKLPAAIRRDFPTISDDFVLPNALKIAHDKEHSSVLRISGQIAMWLHYDVMANILCQVRGSKRVVLFPPADISLLKFVHGETTSSLDVFTTAEQLPRNVHPVESILNEGEVLFIPACWAHATEPSGEGGSVAINVFFKSFDDGAYAAGRDIYGNRDLGVYQNGRRDVERIIKIISNDCEGSKKERAKCVVNTLRADNRRERTHGDVDVKVQKEVARILKSVEGLPDDIGKFYLDRLADELDDFAKTCSG